MATELTTAPIVLEGKDIYSVAFLEGNLAYKAITQRGKDKKTYSRYQMNNVVFTVPTEHPFNLDFANGQIKSITLIPGVAPISNIDDAGVETFVDRATLAFSTCINRAQWNAMQADRVLDASVDFKVARYAHLASATTAITAEHLAELEAN